jgi:transcriptional regulator with XRE-family HTH domain
MSTHDLGQPLATRDQQHHPANSPNHLAILIGRKIRAARHAKRLSLEVVAAEARLAPERLKRLESGSERIEPGELYDLSRVLDKSISYFFKSVKSAIASR